MFNDVRIVGRFTNVDFEYNILFMEVDNKTFSFLFDDTIAEALNENLDKIQGSIVGIVGCLDLIENKQIVKIKKITFINKE